MDTYFTRFYYPLAFVFCLVFSPYIAFSVTVESLSTGDWLNPATWSTNTVPDSSQNVVIKNGHTITLPTTGPASACFDLTIEPGGKMTVLNKNLTIHGNTTISGTFTDIDNAGINLFKGKVTITETGVWNTLLVTSAPRILFTNGLENHGQVSFKRCKFGENDQTISGTSPLVFEDNVYIAAGIKVYNEGTIFFPVGDFYGDDSTATFVNKGIFETHTGNAPVQVAKADFSAEGNTVIYSKYGSMKVRATTYYNLVIATDSANANSKRTLTDGTTRVLNRLTIEPHATFQPDDNNLISEGLTEIFGTFYDNALAGTNALHNVDLSGGLIDGSGNEYPVITISGDFFISTGDGNIEEAKINSTGKTTIAAGRKLFLNSPIGDKIFNTVEVAEGGQFVDASSTGLISFNGSVDIAGAMALDKGFHKFDGPVTTVGDSGVFITLSSKGTFRFNKGIFNHGRFILDADSLWIRKEIGGTAEIALKNSVTIPDNDTLVNSNTGGLRMSGNLNGAGNGSVFLNRGLLIYQPSNTGIPMPTGKMDVCTYPGNTLVFASTKKDQLIPGGCYYNIGFEKGTRKLLASGDIIVSGNIYNSVELRAGDDILTAGSVYLVGDSLQEILGWGDPVFPTMVVEKPSGSVTLHHHIRIQDGLFMVSGTMDTDTAYVLLSEAGVIQESETAYITGKVASLRDIGSGATREFGGMGLKVKVSSGNSMGPTLVIRTTGSAYEPGQIDRYFEVFPTNNTNLGAEVEFTYMEHELSGAVEEDLVMETKVGQNYFEELGGRVLTKSNIVRKTNIDEFGVIALRASSLAVNAYPSPFFDGNLTIEYVVDETQIVDIRIMDTAGRTFVKQRVLAEAGKNQFTVSDMNLAAGIYFVRIGGLTQRGYAKIVKRTL
ncbi:MAG: T9SS type A sorting domain-containing protein [Bacteroidia bacterium]|nr:T9SS type A sorting domain-containing protein [Bacteroidia bacterium]